MQPTGAKRQCSPSERINMSTLESVELEYVVLKTLDLVVTSEIVKMFDCDIFVSGPTVVLLFVPYEDVLPMSLQSI